MTYGELGGVGIPPVYIEAIKRDCKNCPAVRNELCVDERTGGLRKRPHGSRMVVSSGGSDESADKSSP